MTSTRFTTRAHYQRTRSTRATTSSGLRSTSNQYVSQTRRNYAQATYQRQMRSSSAQSRYERQPEKQRNEQTNYSRQSTHSIYAQQRTILSRRQGSVYPQSGGFSPSRRTENLQNIGRDASRIRRVRRSTRNVAGTVGTAVALGATVTSAVGSLSSGYKEERSSVLTRDMRRASAFVARQTTRHTARAALRTARYGYRIAKSTSAQTGVALAGQYSDAVLSATEVANLRRQVKAQTASIAKVPQIAKGGIAQSQEKASRMAFGTSRLRKGLRVAQTGATALRNITSQDIDALVEETEAAVVKKGVKTTAKGGAKAAKKAASAGKRKASEKGITTTKSALLRTSQKKKALIGGRSPRKIISRITNAVGTAIKRIAQSIVSKIGAVIAVKGTIVVVALVAILALASIIGSFLSYFAWFEEEKARSCVVAIDIPDQASPWVSEVAANSGLSAPLVAAIMYQESSFNPDAENSIAGGHYGLVQMSPAIWHTYGGTPGFDANGRPNGIRNVKLYLTVAAKYLKARWDRVEAMRQDNPSALWVKELSMTDSFIVAHNAGEGWLSKYPNLPTETTNFIDTVRAITTTPEASGGNLKDACSVPGGIANGNKIINDAKQFLGVPYEWGGESPSGLDCSGFVKVVFAKQGIQLPHLADSQARLGQEIYTGSGWNVPWDKLKPGDTISFGSSAMHYTHIGIYAGGKQMIHAPTFGDHVRFAPVDTPFWQSDYWSVRRY